MAGLAESGSNPDVDLLYDINGLAKDAPHWLDRAVEFVGEFPRIGELCAELDVPETLFARKNFNLEEMPHDGRHAWVRLTPDKIVSWDFRKLGPA